jgi:HSP20 family molecular chaperone IbpA
MLRRHLVTLQENLVMFLQTFNNHIFRFPSPQAWDLSPIVSVCHDLDRVLGTTASLSRSGGASCDTTHVEFILDDHGTYLTLTANLPGLKESDLKLSATARDVSLSGERKASPPDGYVARRRERKNYAFERTFRLHTLIDPEKAEASLVNGVLTVRLPKTAESQERVIPVQAT